jgi:ParB family chromosome partitioning protein
MANAAPVATELHTIPLSQLVPSTRNVRRVKPGGIEGLAENIAAQGLIQNLAVVPADDGKFEVIVGSRRHAALVLLRKAKRIPKDYGVRCVVRTAEDAVDVSLSENVQREAMHPADECEAFKALVDAGMPIQDVAARYGVSERVVSQRLKLAQVSPKLVKQFRDGKLTLAQMMAFTVSDDHKAQEAVWAAAKHEWDQQPSALRAALLGQVVRADSRLAIYVGLASYEKAGGHVTRDLFGDETDAYLSDAGLLRQLASEKLGKHAANLRKKGYAWVDLAPLDQAFCYSSYPSVDALGLSRSLTDDEKARRAELVEAVAAAERASAALSDDDSTSDEAWEAADSAFLAAEAALEEFDASMALPAEALSEFVGAQIGIDSRGKVKTIDGLVRRDDVAALRARYAPPSREREDGEDGQAETGMGDHRAQAREERESNGLARPLWADLTRERTLALQARLVQQPDKALVLLAHRLIEQVLRDYLDPRSSLLDLSITPGSDPRCVAGAEMARAVLAGEREALQALLPAGDGELLPWLAEQPVSTLVRLVAFCTASCLNTNEGRGSDGFTDTGRSTAGVGALTQYVGLDFADWWEPTAESFLGRVKKSVLADAAEEAGETTTAAAIRKAKKDAAIDAAEKALKGKRWVPAPLRTRS